MKIQVFRLEMSDYQDEHFIEAESRKINSIEGVEYIHSLSSLEPDAKIILLSNTHLQPEKLPSNLLESTVLMIHPNSGYDCFTPEFIKKAPFPIITGNDIRSNAVAEFTLSAIFHRLTSLKNHLFWDKARVWDRKRLLDQKTVILGFGHIGKMLYQSLKPLVRDLTVIDPKIESSDLQPKLQNNLDAKHFEDADILILAANLTETSKECINTSILDKLSEDALIVNPARGKLINQKDLELFLKNNPKAFAYLDVFTTEPFSSSDFKDIRNINKTSHIAGVFKQLNKEIIQFEKRIICDFLEDRAHFNSKHQEHIL